MGLQNSAPGGMGGSGGGSPKDRFVEFYFDEFKCYTTVMRSGCDQDTLDRATVALLSICPDSTTRNYLFKKYTEEKCGVDGPLAASSALAGDFMSYMSDMLEFTEKAYAGVF